MSIALPALSEGKEKNMQALRINIPRHAKENDT